MQPPEKFEYVVGLVSERLRAPLHAVPAIIRERSLGEDGAVRLDAEHLGKSLCGRDISDLLPRMTFEVAVIEHRDMNEVARWHLCPACCDIYELKRAETMAVPLDDGDDAIDDIQCEDAA